MNSEMNQHGEAAAGRRTGSRSRRIALLAIVLPALGLLCVAATLWLAASRSQPAGAATIAADCCPAPPVRNADPVTVTAVAGIQTAGGLAWLFDTTGFPRRWNCGTWPAFLGWMHILSDVAIWGAYMAIPIVLGFFVLKKRMPLPHMTWLFIAFIASCGIGHLIEAVIFWNPVYRLAGVWKVVTAAVSWLTVLALIPVVPKVLRWPSLGEINQQLKREIDQRDGTESTLRELNARLSLANQRHAMTLHELEMQKAALDEHAIVAITDTRGVITYVNEKFCDISGYCRDELIGQTHRIVNSGHHPKSFFVDMWRTIASGQPWRGDICNRAKNGSLYWVDTTIFPFRNEAGEITQYVAIRADITDRERIEQQLRHYTEKLEHSNHELEEFVYTVSHDLKSPIVTIQGFAGLLERELARSDDETIVDSLQRITAATRRMQMNIDDLLELSRIGRVKNDPEIIDTAAMVREVLNDMQGQIDDAGAQIVIDGPLRPVRMDRVRLRQVLQNLISNALKYGRPENGAPRITIDSSACGGMVTLRVTDNGSGIRPDYHDRIFGLFQRLSSNEDGTGVGLAIVRRIAEIHGGRVWVESDPGCGATFLFAVPDHGTADYATAASAEGEGHV